jgi:hypothetical protein
MRTISSGSNAGRQAGRFRVRTLSGDGMRLAVFLLIAAVPQSAKTTESATPAKGLIGTWQATRNFGPLLRGLLTLTRSEGHGLAEIAGQRIPFDASGKTIHCVFPGGQGEFHGALDPKTGEIRGHWIQPATVNAMRRFASPVTLKPSGKEHWRGQVVPLEDEFTLFLVASPGEHGTVQAFLRNPDRNSSPPALSVQGATAARTASPSTSPGLVQPSTSHASTMTRRATFMRAGKTRVNTATAVPRRTMTAGRPGHFRKRAFQKPR